MLMTAAVYRISPLPKMPSGGIQGDRRFLSDWVMKEQRDKSYRDCGEVDDRCPTDDFEFGPKLRGRREIERSENGGGGNG